MPATNEMAAPYSAANRCIRTLVPERRRGCISVQSGTPDVGMRYYIIKFESDYGPPIYRVRRFALLPWRWWVSDADGQPLKFTSKEEAHQYMQSGSGSDPKGTKAKGRTADGPHSQTLLPAEVSAPTIVFNGSTDLQQSLSTQRS